jgi:hypothetical protein
MGNDAANTGIVHKDIETLPPGHGLSDKPHPVGIITQISLDIRRVSEFGS